MPPAAAAAAAAAPPPLPYATPAAFAPHAAGPGPVLSPEHLQQIAFAQKRATKIRRAVKVARFDGWAAGVFGALTLLGGMFGSPVAFVLGSGMIVVAFIELKAAKRLHQLDATAVKTLAWNQVLFGSLLLAYAAYSLWGVYHDKSEISQQLAGMPEMGALGNDLDQLTRMIGVLIYGVLAAVAIFGQGGTALYYLTRKKYVDAYLRETPAWIIDAQRAGLPM